MAKQKINSAQRSEDYSTNETDTGKKWVDGRTIYRKVFRGTVNVISGQVAIAHGIALTSSFEIISMMGGFKLGAGGLTGSDMQMPWYREAGGNWIVMQQIDTSSLYFVASFAWGSSGYSFIVEYVK